MVAVVSRLLHLTVAFFSAHLAELENVSLALLVPFVVDLPFVASLTVLAAEDVVLLLVVVSAPLAAVALVAFVVLEFPTVFFAALEAAAICELLLLVSAGVVPLPEPFVAVPPIFAVVAEASPPPAEWPLLFDAARAIFSPLPFFVVVQVAVASFPPVVGLGS